MQRQSRNEPLSPPRPIRSTSDFAAFLTSDDVRTQLSKNLAIDLSGASGLTRIFNNTDRIPESVTSLTRSYIDAYKNDELNHWYSLLIAIVIRDLLDEEGEIKKEIIDMIQNSPVTDNKGIQLQKALGKDGWNKIVGDLAPIEITKNIIIAYVSMFVLAPISQILGNAFDPKSGALSLFTDTQKSALIDLFEADIEAVCKNQTKNKANFVLSTPPNEQEFKALFKEYKSKPNDAAFLPLFIKCINYEFQVKLEVLLDLNNFENIHKFIKSSLESIADKKKGVVTPELQTSAQKYLEEDVSKQNLLEQDGDHADENPAQLAKLIQQKEQLEERLRNTARKRDELVEQVTRLQTELGESKQNVLTLHEQLENAANEKMIALDHLKEIRLLHEQLKNAANEKMIAIDQVIKETHADFGELTAAQEFVQREKDAHKQEVILLERDIILLKLAKQQREDLISENGRIINNLTEENKALNAKAEKLNSALETAKGLAEEQEEALVKLGNENIAQKQASAALGSQNVTHLQDIHRLTQENAALKAANESLTAEIKTVANESEAMKVTNTTLSAEIQRIKDENTALAKDLDVQTSRIVVLTEHQVEKIEGIENVKVTDINSNQIENLFAEIAPDITNETIESGLQSLKVYQTYLKNKLSKEELNKAYAIVNNFGDIVEEETLLKRLSRRVANNEGNHDAELDFLSRSTRLVLIKHDSCSRLIQALETKGKPFEKAIHFGTELVRGQHASKLEMSTNGWWAWVGKFVAALIPLVGIFSLQTYQSAEGKAAMKNVNRLFTPVKPMVENRVQTLRSNKRPRPRYKDDAHELQLLKPI